MEKRYISTSIEDTKEIAREILSELGSKNVIALSGDLASGKTTFTQGVGAVLGVSRVTSPTYMIMREYKIEDSQFFDRLFHLDLYRLSSADEIKSFELQEIWEDNRNLLIIEWPEKFFDYLPPSRLDITIKSLAQDEREITIKN